jgi:hypothetical protein
VTRWRVGAFHVLTMGTLPGPPGTSLGSLNPKQPPHIPFGRGGEGCRVSCVIVCKKIVSTLLEENARGVAIFQPHNLPLAVDGAT